MGDRVAFAGPYFAGFPFEVWTAPDSSVVGPGTAYPFAMTRSKFAELYWRIKRFSVSVGSWEALGGTGTFDTAARERDLCRAYNVGVAGSGIGDLTPPDYPGNQAIANSLFGTPPEDPTFKSAVHAIGVSLFWNYPKAYIYDGSYYPGVWVSVEFKMNYWSGDGFWNGPSSNEGAVSADYSSGILTQISSGTLKIGGVEYTFPFYDANGESGLCPAFGPVLIEATKYWPYATRSGAPVWNETTGALNPGVDPLS
jgi:hypothetical protein